MTSMDTRPLGHSGIQVSLIGLGCNQFGGRVDLNGTRAVIDTAISNGITFLDTADRYNGTKSEEFIGEALKGRRDEVVLATKFGMEVDDGWTGPRGAPEYIRHAVANSLRRLQTDVIDMYWYHRPDGVPPIADTLEALDALVKAGTVRAIGVSNFSATQLAEADSVAKQRGLTPFSAIQNDYSLLHRDPEADVLPLCEKLDIAFIPFYPLASGLLTGRYKRGVAAPEGARLAKRERLATDEQWDVIEKLSGFADEHHVPLPELAIASLLAQPAVSSVIAGVSRPEQVETNAAAVKRIPDAKELAALQQLLAE
jgi:aryl-alcohol dehydrogenase-like predicted oxidoreductase